MIKISKCYLNTQVHVLHWEKIRYFHIFSSQHGFDLKKKHQSCSKLKPTKGRSILSARMVGNQLLVLKWIKNNNNGLL